MNSPLFKEAKYFIKILEKLYHIYLKPKIQSINFPWEKLLHIPKNLLIFEFQVYPVHIQRASPESVYEVSIVLLGTATDGGILKTLFLDVHTYDDHTCLSIPDHVTYNTETCHWLYLEDVMWITTSCLCTTGLSMTQTQKII